MLTGLMRDGMSPSAAAKTAARLIGAPRNRSKQLALELAGSTPDTVEDAGGAVDVSGLDHVVLRAHSLPRLEAFYCDLLGARVARRNEAFGLVHLRVGACLLDIRQADDTSPAPAPGSLAPPQDLIASGLCKLLNRALSHLSVLTRRHVQQTAGQLRTTSTTSPSPLRLLMFLTFALALQRPLLPTSRVHPHRPPRVALPLHRVAPRP
jgi:hypothetical protein